MKVSVITVSFNSAATIGYTLDSVACQQGVDVEHVVVDGGSTDHTLQIIARSSDRRLCWQSEPDQGIYDAMNKGVARAKGDVIGFLNADDSFADDHVLSEVMRCFESPDVVAVYGDLVYVSADDGHRVVRHWRSGAYTPASLKFGWMPPHPTFYVRRSVFESIGRFDTSLRIAADYDLLVATLMDAKGRVAHVPRILVKMRTGGISNGSLRAVLRKSREDLAVIHGHRLWSLATLAFKNVRKLVQFR